MTCTKGEAEVDDEVLEEAPQGSEQDTTSTLSVRERPMLDHTLDEIQEQDLNIKLLIALEVHIARLTLSGGDSKLRP